MNFIKHKLGILLLIICVGAMVAVIWYCLFELSNGQSDMQGTLVEGMTWLKEMAML